MFELDELKKLITSEWDDYSQEQTRNLVRRWEEAVAAEELAKHFVIKEFLGGLKAEIEAINDQLRLKYSKDLPDRARDNLLDRRELYKQFINLFAPKREAVEKEIKETLSDARRQK